MANVLMTKYNKKPRKVKRKKAKPRIRKPKARTAKQRSRAAKKGWKNRKKREREFLKKAREDRKKKGKKGAVQQQAELELILRDLVLKRGDILAQIRSMPEDDREEALEKIIHAYGEVNFVEIDAEDEELLKIRARLRMADEEGNLEEVMHEISEEYNMPPNEVYTQWLYSGVQ